MRFALVACMTYMWCIRFNHSKLYIDDFGWNEFDVNNKHLINDSNFILKGDQTSRYVDKQVFISIATISIRINMVYDTIISLLNGYVIPDRIYLFISREPKLLDEGIDDSMIPERLLTLSKYYPLSIVYVRNIGPHRKLLPLLSRHRNDDVLIITADDDTILPKDFLLHLLQHYYYHNEQSVIAYRARRIGFCNTHPYKVLSYGDKTWDLSICNTQELLVLPTGTGGILYHPSFFHTIVFDPDFRNITETTDDITFRLACMVNNVKVKIACMSDNEERYSAITTTANHILSQSPIIKKIFQNFIPYDVSEEESSSKRSEKVVIAPTGVGLYTKMNRDSSNNGDNWYRGAMYLLERNIMNFTDITIQHLLEERSYACFNMSHVFTLEDLDDYNERLQIKSDRRRQRDINDETDMKMKMLIEDYAGDMDHRARRLNNVQRDDEWYKSKYQNNKYQNNKYPQRNRVKKYSMKNVDNNRYDNNNGNELLNRPRKRKQWDKGGIQGAGNGGGGGEGGSRGAKKRSPNAVDRHTRTKICSVSLCGIHRRGD